MNFKPFQSRGLCDAVTTTPPLLFNREVLRSTVGVGTTPRFIIEFPVDRNPLVKALSIKSPVLRVSLPITILPDKKFPNDKPKARESCGKKEELTIPLTPEIPRMRPDI